jgi:hypothetical protein
LCLLVLCLLVGLAGAVSPAQAGDPPVAPGAPAPAARPPGLVLDAYEHDFGIVEQNNEYAVTIPYRNTGPNTITDLKASADCGCYAAAVSKTTLAPGESGEVSIQFRTLTFRGVINKKLSLLYDDGGPKRAQVALRVKVFGGVIVDPGRVYFGEILEGSSPEGAVDLLWYPDAGEPFEVERIDVGEEPLETTVTPYADPEHAERKGWHVTFRFTEPPPRGVYSKKAVVYLTHPRTPKVRVPLTAHVVGKVWMQTSRIHLGLVARGDTPHATVLLRHFDGKTPLGAISGSARKGVLQVTIEDSFSPPGPNTPPLPAKLVRVTVPKDAPVGALNDDIVIQTKVPGEEQVVIQVRGRIYERTGG